MKRNLVVTFFTFCFALVALSQEKETFKPSGKIIVRSFFDYSTNFDNESGFDITRALLGYNYQMSPTLSGQVVIDGAAGNKDSRLEVYVRNAFINWKDYNFDVNVGLTGLLQFSIQEKYWMHRYVLKSYQDLNKMGHSVDLGFTAQYKFNDLLSADISITNGTGYKEVKKSGSQRNALGLSISPIKNTIFRVYADLFNDSKDLRDDVPSNITEINYRNQYTVSLFAGYQNKYISGGLEYNKVFNKGFVKEKDYYGYSAYASVRILPKWRVYGRYDQTESSSPKQFSEKWNSGDGLLIIGGIEFTPVKHIKISPNIRNMNYIEQKSEQQLFINVEFAL